MNSRVALRLPQTAIARSPSRIASRHFLIRINMGRGGVEVVSRPIEIHGHEVDEREPVLLAIGLPLHEKLSPTLISHTLEIGLDHLDDQSLKRHRQLAAHSGIYFTC